MTYLALLRGINVGGNNLIAMTDLKICFEELGFSNVRTYIQTGNVFFDSDETPCEKLEILIFETLQQRYKSDIAVVVFNKQQWQKFIDDAPKNWGHDNTMKHNLIIMLRPYNMDDVMSAIGELKPSIEKVSAGEGVVYQSLSLKDFGKTTSGKIASNPIYKKMTIRNFNTANKLLNLFDA